MATATREAEQLLKESLTELESAKGSVLTGVQRLVRAARLLGDEDVVIWCEIQFGTTKYTGPLNKKRRLIQESLDSGFDKESKLTKPEEIKKENIADNLSKMRKRWNVLA